MHIDTIEKRARDTVSVAHNLFSSTAAAIGAIPQITTGAWVHGGDELKAGGVFRLLCGSGNGDAAALHGFPQDFQYPTFELRQFIKE
jgi:hypothetical protein